MSNGWNYVRIEPSATETGFADLFLMDEAGRFCDVTIAHLAIRGEPSRMSVLDEPNWRLLLDGIAWISARTVNQRWVSVETSDGEVWVHFPEDRG
jgi:hypothetical protein